MPLEFTADLVVDADGVPGRVTGEGSTLRVHADDPRRFVDELRAAGPSDTQGIRRAAEFLAGQGVSVRISGPHGDVVTIGADASSWVGRLAAGTRRVAPGRPRAAAPLLWGRWVDAARRPAARLAAAATLVAVVGWVVGRVRPRR